jgi:Flp pilus assembly protein TadD
MSRRAKNLKARLEQSEPQRSEDEIIERRAQRFLRKGQYRKAALVLRKLAGSSEEPRHWVTLGHMWRRARRRDQALDALKQGMFLHKRRGASDRARTVARMILELDPQDSGAFRLADR